MKQDAETYGNSQHEYMLGAGRAWFVGKYPEEWAKLKDQPLERGIEAMIAFLGKGTGQ